MSLDGREHELSRIEQLLAKPGAGAITLTGPAGIGKTAVAQEIAARVGPRFEHGVALVDLSHLTDAQIAEVTIARALGLQQAGAAMVDWVRDRSLLLVLDDVDAVPGVASAIAELMAASPRLKLLSTSTKRLGVWGEEEVALAPLDSGPRALQGNPLALALAAASPEVAPMLESSPGLSGVLRLVFALLRPGQRTVFAHLSVFSGGFTLQAAQALGAGAAEITALERRRLVAQRNGRFDLSPTLRRFAAQSLTDPSQAKDAHAGCFTRLAREVGARVDRSATSADLDLLERELDNFRAALGWLQSQQAWQRGLELVAPLARCFDMRGRWEEGRRLLTAFAAEGTDPVLRGRALNHAGIIAFRQGDFTAAVQLHERALTLDDPATQLDAVDRLQWCAMYQGRIAEGIALSERGWAMAQQLDNPRQLARAKGQRAWAMFEQDDRREAEALYLEVVHDYEQLPDRPDLAHALNALGEVQRARAHFDDARISYERALELSREVGFTRQVSVTLYNLAMVAKGTGDRDGGLRYLLESIDLTRKIGNGQNQPIGLISLAYFAALKGKAKVGAKLLGAADAALNEVGGSVGFADKDDVAAATGLCRAFLGGGAFDTLRTEGAQLSLEAALRLAKEALTP